MRIAKRGSLPKVTGTIEELRMLESKVVKTLENWKNIMARRKLLFKLFLENIKRYYKYIYCYTILFLSIYPIINILCFVALGLVLKDEGIVPCLTSWA